jgi:hypothetical protein
MSDLELTMMRRVGELNKENSALKAEVERLTALVGADAIDREHGMCCDASAQVERLTKAGDGLYKSMLEIGCNEMADNFQYDAWWGSMNAWNAVKEDKQP